ncbi:MAG: DUF1232 domain-containing protein [Planctomycetaceae bacterium]|nr:DUF1232 domain-containing protein [Planctomycetaceae bacterium]
MWRDWRITLRRLVRDVLAMCYGLRHAKVPLTAKAVSILPILYLLMPADLIPDIFPIIGWLDDLATLPVAAYLADRLTPPAVMSVLRGRADETLVRRWPRIRLWIVGFVAVWIMLAALGGSLFLRGPRQPIPEEVMIDRIVSGQMLPNHDVDDSRGRY